MRWLEIEVATGRDSAEAVSEILRELGAGGIAVDDDQNWEQAKKYGLGDIFPERGPDTGFVFIRGYFPLSFLKKGEELLAARLDRLPEFGLAAATYSTRRVDDTDWANAWKEHWQATPVGEKILIVPAWLPVPEPDGRIVLRLDPGPAFGTGTHESTCLCLEFLEQTVNKGDTVLDLGCGSGILALCARMLGADAVLGLDYDEAAVQFSRENADVNGLDGVRFRRADLLNAGEWDRLEAADLILANLTADLLIEIAPFLYRVVRSGSRLIASGIVRERAKAVDEAFFAAGLTVLARSAAGEWVALLLENKV